MRFNLTYQELFHELNNYHYELVAQGLTDIEAIEVKRQVLKLFMADRMKKYVIETGSKDAVDRMKKYVD